jgi:predicted AAA+ superfamily ATPase
MHIRKLSLNDQFIFIFFKIIVFKSNHNILLGCEIEKIENLINFRDEITCLRNKELVIKSIKDHFQQEQQGSCSSSSILKD